MQEHYMNKHDLMAAIEQRKEKVKQAEVLLEDYKAELKSMKDKLKYLCSDLNCKNIQHVEDYIPGSYYDKGYTIYSVNCSVCNFYKELYSKSDGFYG